MANSGIGARAAFRLIGKGMRLAARGRLVEPNPPRTRGVTQRGRVPPRYRLAGSIFQKAMPLVTKSVARVGAANPRRSDREIEHLERC
jgi:hypothetical protein